MFVLFGINTRTREPERVTQNASAAALRRMWSAYPSAAIGDLDGDADDVEVKLGTDRAHVAALTRAIVRAQRGDVTAHAEPAEDRNAKPAKVLQPAPAPEPAEDNEPEDDPAPAAPPAKLPPLHRHANDNVPCPVADCGDPSAPYTSTLPVELRALCKRHRDNAQANRSKGMTVADALETVLASGRARLARANAAANKAPAVDPRAELGEILAQSSAVIADATFAQVLRMDRDPPPIGPIDDAALAPIFDRLDAVADAATAPSDALTRADFAAVLRELRGALRVALDVAIARLESPR